MARPERTDDISRAKAAYPQWRQAWTAAARRAGLDRTGTRSQAASPTKLRQLRLSSSFLAPLEESVSQTADTFTRGAPYKFTRM